jgi:hypothetical protein
MLRYNGMRREASSSGMGGSLWLLQNIGSAFSH